jgi:hypothetical protein
LLDADGHDADDHRRDIEPTLQTAARPEGAEIGGELSSFSKLAGTKQGGALPDKPSPPESGDAFTISISHDQALLRAVAVLRERGRTESSTIPWTHRVPSIVGVIDIGLLEIGSARRVANVIDILATDIIVAIAAQITGRPLDIATPSWIPDIVRRIGIGARCVGTNGRRTIAGLNVDHVTPILHVVCGHSVETTSVELRFSALPRNRRGSGQSD